MTQLQPLMALLEQAQTERDAALAQHQQALQAYEAAKLQATQLVDYRSDYEQRWTQRFSNEGSAELLQCYQGFANRLTQAVDHQGRMIDHTARQLEHARADLTQHELRVASVRKLIERRVQTLRVQGERREQNQLDERASRAAWDRRANATTRY